MSALGYKQTLAGLKTTSALHPGADLLGGVAEGPFLTQPVPQDYAKAIEWYPKPFVWTQSADRILEKLGRLPVPSE